MGRSQENQKLSITKPQKEERKKKGDAKTSILWPGTSHFLPIPAKKKQEHNARESPPTRKGAEWPTFALLFSSTSEKKKRITMMKIFCQPHFRGTKPWSAEEDRVGRKLMPISRAMIVGCKAEGKRWEQHLGTSSEKPIAIPSAIEDSRDFSGPLRVHTEAQAPRESNT